MTPDELDRVTALVDTRRFEHAERMLTQLLAEDPDDPDCWRLLAMSRLLQRDWAQAERFARSAIGLDAGNEHAWRILSAALGEQGRYDDSVTAARAAVDLRPDFWLPYVALAGALRAGRSPDLSAALAAAKAAVDLDPHQASAYNAVGVVLRELGDRRQARRAFREAARLDPLNEWAVNNLAADALTRGRLSGAASLLSSGLAVAPQDRTLHRNLDVLWISLVRRMSLAVLVLSFVLAILMVPATSGLASAPPWGLRAGVGAVMLGVYALLARRVVRRLPRGATLHLRGLFGRIRPQHKLLVVLLAVLTAITCWQAFAPTALALDTWQRTRPVVNVLLGVLVVVAVGDRLRTRAKPRSYGDSGRG